MQQGSEALDLEQALRILRRRMGLVVLCVVVVGGAAFAYSRHEHKTYTATAALAFRTNQVSQQALGLPPVSDPVVQQASNVELVKLGDMAAKTASLLRHGLTPEKVTASISVSGLGESSIVAVSATAGSAALAAMIANTYASQFVTEQQLTNRQSAQSALALVNRELAKLSRDQRRDGAGLNLQSRAETLGLLAELDYGSPRIAQQAVAPSSPASPKTSRNTGLGVLLGLLIGLGLAFVLEHLDRRIKGPEDLEAIYRLPILGGVPRSTALAGASKRARNKQAVSPLGEAETFNLILAHLRFFSVERDLRTILIASPADGDGKTTIASHLAGAAARRGARVLLLELDLRNPTLCQRLQIQAGPGVAEVLTGAVGIGEAIRRLPLGACSGADISAHTLDVLSAGAVAPPNPAELLDTRAMDLLLLHAKSEYDLVVIDTPPLTVVSDAFPLLAKVDGSVIIGWVGRSRRDEAQQLHGILASSGAPLLGVIANGARSACPSSYSSATHHAPSRGVAPSGDSLSPDGLVAGARV